MLKTLLRKGGHTTTRIFSNPYLKLGATTRDIYASQEAIEEQRIHEKLPQEDPKVFLSHPCKKAKEIKEPWTTFNGDNTLEPDIEEFLACLSQNPLCIEECNVKI